MQISFYHLTRLSLEKSLPKLLEKILSQGLRTVVVAETEPQVQILNDTLWTYHPTSFLPHGTEKEGRASDQPIWITSKIENPNGAQVLVFATLREKEGFDAFSRVLYMFDGNRTENLEKAGGLWKKYKEVGHSLAYWQQDAEGKWVSQEPGDSF